MAFTKQPKAAGPTAKRLALAKAWRNIQSGNNSREDFEAVFIDMLQWADYYRRPSYADWLDKNRTPESFQTHCALMNARCDAVRHIMDYLSLDDDAMVALERAARAEASR